MDQRIINLYDEYTHKPLSRNEFINRLAVITGSMTAAMAILPFIEVNGTKAAVTPDQDLFTERVNYPGVNTDMQAYVARPKDAKTYAAVVVIHENRGLNAHIEDVARRAAAAGYLAIAPNALSPLGGTPADDDEARTKFFFPKRAGRTCAGSRDVQIFLENPANRMSPRRLKNRFLPSRSADAWSAGSSPAA